MPPEMSAPVIIVPPILFFVLSSIGQFCHGVSQATKNVHSSYSEVLQFGFVTVNVELSGPTVLPDESFALTVYVHCPFDKVSTCTEVLLSDSVSCHFQ